MTPLLCGRQEAFSTPVDLASLTCPSPQPEMEGDRDTGFCSSLILPVRAENSCNLALVERGISAEAWAAGETSLIIQDNYTTVVTRQR